MMPWAGIQFDETHQNMLAQALVEQFIGQGFRVVFPSDATKQTMIWPAAGAAPDSTVGSRLPAQVVRSGRFGHHP